MKESEVVSKIKDALRACTTVAEVNAVSDQYRPQVKALASDPNQRVFAIHISNLKTYKIRVDLGYHA